MSWLLLGWAWLLLFAPKNSFSRTCAIVALLYLVLSSCAPAPLRLPASAYPANYHRPGLRCLIQCRQRPVPVGPYRVPVHLQGHDTPARVYVFTVAGRPLWQGPAAQAASAPLPDLPAVLIGITTEAGQWQIRKVVKPLL